MKLFVNYLFLAVFSFNKMTTAISESLCHTRSNWSFANTDDDFSMCPVLSTFIATACGEYDAYKFDKNAEKSYLCELAS